MSFEITGHKAALQRVRSFGLRHTPRPMRFASPASGLSRVLPASLSSTRRASLNYIDRFGMIVSTNEENSDADRT